MNKTEIELILTGIFRKELNEPSLKLKDEMTANDVDNWDSLSHMLLITEIEKQFSIKFKLKELNKLKNVGALINIIESKMVF